MENHPSSKIWLSCLKRIQDGQTSFGECVSESECACVWSGFGVYFVYSLLTWSTVLFWEDAILVLGYLTSSNLEDVK
jgi:hypothetical protein